MSFNLTAIEFPMTFLGCGRAYGYMDSILEPLMASSANALSLLLNGFFNTSLVNHLLKYVYSHKAELFDEPCICDL